ncbi:hypothetical protein [Furfurilactobacillus cerevisiae]
MLKEHHGNEHPLPIRKSGGGNDKRAIVTLSKVRRLLFFMAQF